MPTPLLVFGGRDEASDNFSGEVKDLVSFCIQVLGWSLQATAYSLFLCILLYCNLDSS